MFKDPAPRAPGRPGPAPPSSNGRGRLGPRPRAEHRHRGAAPPTRRIRPGPGRARRRDQRPRPPAPHAHRGLRPASADAALEQTAAAGHQPEPAAAAAAGTHPGPRAPGPRRTRRPPAAGTDSGRPGQPSSRARAPAAQPSSPRSSWTGPPQARSCSRHAPRARLDHDRLEHAHRLDLERLADARAERRTAARADTLFFSAITAVAAATITLIAVLHLTAPAALAAINVTTAAAGTLIHRSRLPARRGPAGPGIRIEHMHGPLTIKNPKTPAAATRHPHRTAATASRPRALTAAIAKHLTENANSIRSILTAAAPAVILSLLLLATQQLPLRIRLTGWPADALLAAAALALIAVTVTGARRRAELRRETDLHDPTLAEIPPRARRRRAPPPLAIRIKPAPARPQARVGRPPRRGGHQLEPDQRAAATRPRTAEHDPPMKKNEKHIEIRLCQLCRPGQTGKSSHPRPTDSGVRAAPVTPKGKRPPQWPPTSRPAPPPRTSSPSSAESYSASPPSTSPPTPYPSSSSPQPPPSSSSPHSSSSPTGNPGQAPPNSAAGRGTPGSRLRS